MIQATETPNRAEPINSASLRSSVAPCWASDDGNVQLWNADCLDVLPLLSGIDALISDPPYGINFDFTKNRSRKGGLDWGNGDGLQADRKWDNIIGDDKPFDPAPFLGFPKIILWGGNHYAERLPCAPCWLVWDKKVYTTSDNHSDCELAWTNLPGVVRRFYHLWRGVVRAGAENVSNGPKLHPVQKPAALMAWCVSLCKLQQGATVLDPFMGSGTTGIACIRSGRRFIGIEKDAKYFEIAKERIRKELQVGRLF